MTGEVGALTEVHRYPVKSLLGESLSSCEVEPRGLLGDRSWAVRDERGKLGSGKSSRRFTKMQGLLGIRSSLPPGRDVPVVTASGGLALDADDPLLAEELGRLVGRPVDLRPERDVPHHDDGPVHLLTTASLRWLAAALGHEAPVARFRPNLVVDTPGLEGTPEQDWVGREVRVGTVVLRVVQPMPRCVMTTMAQADLDADPDVLRTLTDRADADFGVLLEVVTPGRVAVGDAVALA